MSVLVVCDSTAALAASTAAQWGVQVVPLTVTVAGTPYDDGHLDDAELECASHDAPVSTAAPAPGRWLDVVERYAADGAVLVTVASRLSSSAQSAQLAARLAVDSGRVVRVVDSATAAGGEALVVLAAAGCAREGGAVDDVARRAEEVAGGVRLVGTLGSLDRLVVSGRVPGVAAAAGRALGARPVFELVGGRVRPQRPAFSRAAALQRLVDRCLASRPPQPDVALDVVVSHALAAQDAECVRRSVVAALEPRTCTVGRFGSALLAHAGPGTVGLSWCWVDRAGRPIAREPG